MRNIKFMRMSGAAARTGRGHQEKRKKLQKDTGIPGILKMYSFMQETKMDAIYIEIMRATI